jgi:WD40 repeat protein
VYDHQKSRRVRVMEGTYAQVNRLLFSPDASTLAGEVETLHCPTCTEMEGLDPYMVLWRSSDGSIITKMEQQGQSGWLGYSQDGSRLAGLQMGNVQIFSTSDGSSVDQIDGFTAQIEGLALSPDGKTLASVHGTQPYTLRFWDLDDGLVSRLLQDRPEGGALTNVAVAFSPDQEILAVGGDIWDTATGERLNEMERAITGVTSCWSSGVAFSPDGDTLATGCFDGQLDLWHVPDGALVKRIGSYSSWVDEPAFSPDGEYLAAAYNVPDYLVQVWQLPQGDPAFKLQGGHFTRLAYSPDGGTLATILANQEYDQYGWPAGYVQLWNASDGKQLNQLEVEDAVSLAFSPDGQILATGSLDGTLRLWEMPGGRMLLESGGHFGQIQRLVFTPDGTSLVSASLDGTIIRWGIPDPSSP